MTVWKKGRGKLGFLKPLLGTWTAQADSPMGPLRCERTIAEVLNGSYVRLEARWAFGKSHGTGKGYDELALIGAGGGREVRIWSFTSDGKHSHGKMADVTDLHPEAVGFEMEVPAGLARMAYWPAGEDGFVWVVEARTKKGWSRFTEHLYRRAR